MAMKCPRFGCSADVHPETYDGPVRCENGHPLRLIRGRVQEFLDRATREVKA